MWTNKCGNSEKKENLKFKLDKHTHTHTPTHGAIHTKTFIFSWKQRQKNQWQQQQRQQQQVGVNPITAKWNSRETICQRLCFIFFALILIFINFHFFRFFHTLKLIIINPIYRELVNENGGINSRRRRRRRKSIIMTRPKIK